ncbi:hypothetical protein RYX36_013684 [Vicia faba]
MKRFNPESIDDDSVSFEPQSSFLRRVSTLNHYQTQTMNQNVDQNQNPSGNDRRFLHQIMNPCSENQTLEAAFSRLSVGASSNGYGGSSFHENPYYNHGVQATNCCFNRENAIGFNALVRNNSAYGRGRPMDFLLRHNGYGNDYGYGDVNNLLNGGVSVPVAGNGVGDGLRPGFQYGLLNESSVPNVSWVNGIVNHNGKGTHWVDQFRGTFYSMAKDQSRSMILGGLIEKFGREAVSHIFAEVIDYVSELMVDPFGNVVVQKMVGLCNENQLTRIILMVTSYECQLIRLSVDLYGFRSIEKLCENATTRDQRRLIMSALNPAAILLSKDVNGHRVALSCLRNFPHEDTKIFLSILATNSLSIARDKTGCCVMQYCASHAQGEPKNRLIDDIVLNAPLLAEDCYGNYVLQHLLSMKIQRVSSNLHRQLEGRFVYLSCNKYGSNVVEKFFHDAGVLLSEKIIAELLNSPNVSRLLVDPFGNYVICTALMKFKGNPYLKNALLDLIQANSLMMRSNMFGKKLLDRADKELRSM